MTWRDLAACVGMDTRAFFPPGHESVAPECEAACRRCEVRVECLADALSYSEADDHGYRALTYPRHRRTIRERRRRGAA